MVELQLETEAELLLERYAAQAGKPKPNSLAVPFSISWKTGKTTRRALPH